MRSVLLKDWKISLCLCLFISGCNEARPVQVATPQVPQGASNTKNDGDGLGDLKSKLGNSKGSFIDAEFAGALTVIGIEICTLNLRVKLLPISALQTGKIFDLATDQFADCGLFGEVDVSKLLGGLSGGQGQGPGQGLGGLNAEVENNVVYLNAMGGSTFSPGRPIFPAIGAASRAELNGMSAAREVVVNMSGGKQALGNAVMNVPRFGGSYTASKMGYTFEDSAEIKLEHIGFENLDALNTFLLPREMTMVMGLKPFAVAHIGLKLELRKLTDLFKNGEINNQGQLPPGIGQLIQGGGGGGIIGTIAQIAIQLIKVDVTLDLLKADFPEDDSDEVDENWANEVKSSRR